jgi:hypothetical protein
MRRVSDRFAEAAEACGDLPQLGALLSDIALELGFQYFALLDHVSLATPGAGLVRGRQLSEGLGRRTSRPRLCGGRPGPPWLPTHQCRLRLVGTAQSDRA